MRALCQIVSVIAAAFLAGCTTTSTTPSPAPVVDLTAGNDAGAATLHTVIVRGNSETWDKNTLWDEYVITLANRGEHPLTIESIVVDDVLNQRQVASDDPKKLLQNSQNNWRAYRKGKVPVTKQHFETNALEAVAAGAFVAVELAYLWPLELALLPAAVAKASKDLAEVKAGFALRRIPLPLTLPPDTSVKGSVFFPMIAAPRSLVVRTRSSERAEELAMNLTPLSTLHLVTTNTPPPPMQPVSPSLASTTQ